MRKEAEKRGSKVSERELKNIFLDADLNEDGEVDFKEFVVMLSGRE